MKTVISARDIEELIRNGGEAGLKGLYRGVTPRIALGVWQTICMVALGDVAKV